MIVIAPNSFKGSLTALEAAQAMEQGLRRVAPQADIRLVPMADGGEGTLDAILAAVPGRRATAVVRGAGGKPVTAAYGVLPLPEGDTAVLESAQVIGLSLADTPVGTRSSCGLGELLRLCLDQGLRRFLLGLGGSSIIDGGAGLLQALGARLYDPQGAALDPTPDGLARLAAVDLSQLDARLKQAQITLLSDVTNPLCGAHGAAAVFGPQKGVLPQEIALYDERLQRWADLCDRAFGRTLAGAEGTAAAGGLGYALQCVGGRHRLGAEVVAETVRLDDALARAQWALTGEGRSDVQTLSGKGPYIVAAHARRYNVPVALLSGGIEQESLAQLAAHFAGCFAVHPQPVSLAEARRDARAALADRAEYVARRYLKIGDKD